jgi:phage terminase large subunit-like protein
LYSTAGDKHSIGHQIYEHACKVRDGAVKDPTFLPVIYEAPDDADYADVEVWKRANPGWGITVEESYMRKAIDDCANMPSRLNALLRYHLNIWADKDTAWIPSQIWAACSERFDPQSLVGRDCWAALDLSATVDVTCSALVFPLEDDRWAVLPRFYVPDETADRREKLDRVPYRTWIRQGHITGTKGRVVDYQAARRDLNDLKSIYHIRGIAYDDWNASQLVQQLKDDGFDMHEFRQGWKSFSEPCKKFETLVIDKKLLHNDDPVLKWMASNVVAVTDAAGNLKPEKGRSRDKIDGIVATIMALGLALHEGATDGKSVYETRGVLRF